MSDSPILVAAAAADPAQTMQHSAPADDSAVVDAYSSSRALSAITLRVKAPPVDALVPDALPSLHLLPCRIAHTGPAAVPNYFRPQKAAPKQGVLTFSVNGAQLSQDDTESYDARFRGRQISGSIVQLPSTARGFVFEEDETQTIDVDADEAVDGDGHPTESESKEAPPQQTAWKTSSTFSSFMLWQPDMETHDRQQVKAAVNEWMHIARAIHAPVTAE